MHNKDVLSKLYNVSDDYESTVLDGLAIKAGLKWVCDCRWHNRVNRNTCESCGKRRMDLDKVEYESTN